MRDEFRHGGGRIETTALPRDRRRVNTVEKASAFVGKTFSFWVILMACFGFFAPQLFTGYKSANRNA
jgi:hypothetical protein